MLLISLLAAGYCFSSPLGGPVPGYVLDSRSGTIRPLLGIPGGMQLGAALTLPFQVTSAEFSFQGDVALVVSNETPSHAYIVRNLANPNVIDLGSVPDGSSVLAVNSSGQAAILVASGQMQFVTGIATTPSISTAVSTNSLVGPITAGVLDDAGQCALVGTASDSIGGFETLCSDGTSTRIIMQSGMRISAIALANSGQDAILADTTGQQILRASHFAQLASITTLAGAVDGIVSPVGVQVSGQQAFVADSSASAVFVIDLTGQNATTSVQLATYPARLKFLSDRTVATLSDPSSPVFTIFDFQTMRSFFVPNN